MANTSTTSLAIISFNCRGFNSIKSQYIASLMSKCSILYLQEHWLADTQMSLLGNVCSDVSYTGVSGFDNSDILSGRPYGGCALLWHSNLLINVLPVNVNSNRVCAVRVCVESVYFLLINVYMPYEDGDEKTDEYVHVLSLVEDIIENNGDCHIILGGDFNVDFTRDRTHTALLTSFCDNTGLFPSSRHALYDIDYTYNFSMKRFNILDHFIVSDTLFNTCLAGVSVFHDVDNLSDHDPIVLRLNIDVKSIALVERVFTPRVSWVKASDDDISNYRAILVHNLKCMHFPAAALLCMNMNCTDPDHHSAICEYAQAITDACLSAAESSIPHTSKCHTGNGCVPGWTERVEPLREKSLFWHKLWVECGRPRTGAVADCMRRTRASYHYSIRQVKKDRDLIVSDRIADALIKDPSRNFWDEVKKIRANKVGIAKIVDGCTDDGSIAELFAQKYRSLYSSVPFDTGDMQIILAELDNMITNGRSNNAVIVSAHDVISAISKLNPHKNDGSCGLSTDHFLRAGPELSVHIAFLFTCMISHGSSPKDFGISTIIPIPKKHNTLVADSNNFRGIALSSVFCKLFDNIILDKFQNNLCSSEQQFGFKRHSSTHMCTMILKETISYYSKNRSSIFCSFLDASKAFDRVQYCKLFRLLIKRGLPACIVRILIQLYTGNTVRVLWAGLTSDYFTALNGVKQGGVLSPILFCIYIDDLLIRLKNSGVGCFIGLNYVGALAYADDIVLVAPTPTAMRKLLSICDVFASEFDIIFNTEKSKFLVIVSGRRRSLYSDLSQCVFLIGGKPMENVNMYSHLGHIITSSFLDSNDITSRRNGFIGQVNSLLCFFNKLDVFTRLKLFKSYCTSMYGCELWMLNSNFVEDFCVAWKKAVRRVINLPYNTHSYLLPLLTDTLPILDEICKRSARFIVSCLVCSCKLVQSVAWHSIVAAKYNSVLGSNAWFCCERYGWSVDQFIEADIDLSNCNFFSHCRGLVSYSELSTACSLLEVISIREGLFFVPLPVQYKLSRTDLDNIISTLAIT